MTDKIDVEVSATTAKAVGALNDLIDKLGALNRSGPQAAKAIDAVEKSAAGIAASLKAGTSSVNQQAQAIKALVTQYQALNKQGLKGTGSITQRLNNSVSAAQKQVIGSLTNQTNALVPLPKSKSPGTAFDNKTNAELAAQVALEKQRQAALTNSASAQARFNAYQKASNSRQAALEQKDLVTSQKGVTAEINRQTVARTQQVAAINKVSAAQMAYARGAGSQYGKDVNIQSLANQRYALYDVARAWTFAAGATLGFSAAVIKVGIDYQKSFAQVQRTVAGTSEQLNTLRANLIELSTTIPVAFADLANIAALGGQLGVGARDITAFTQVVAELSATTNLTAEAAGTALGRFRALFSQQDTNFSALGSAILKVGVNSVATESQIVNTSTQIASMGRFAGLTAEQVVGLSGALASVGTQPELSRGTITRVFTNMAVAVQGGGDKLAEFARISGVSADQFKATWGTPQFAATFQKFLAGLGTEGQNAIGTLKDLGITSTRDVPTLLKLAGAGQVVQKAFANAASGYKDNTELARQYAITASTVASKLTVLGNTIKGIMNSTGSETLGPLAAMLDIVQGISKALLAFSGTGVGKVLGILAVSLSAVIGAFLALRAAQALTTASAYAFVTAEAALNAEADKTGLTLGTLTGKMLALTIGTGRAAAAQEAYAVTMARTSGMFARVKAGAAGASAAVGGLNATLRGAAIVAAIGLAVGVLGAFANAQAKAKAEVDQLSASLDQQTTAFTENSRTSIASLLEEKGALTAGQTLGLQLNVLTDALLGNAAARQTVADAIARVNAQEQAAVNDPSLYTEGLVHQQDAADKLTRVMGGLGSKLSDAQAKTARLAQASGDASQGMEGMGGSAQDAAGSAADLTTALQDIIDTQYGIVGGTVDVQNSLSSLGQSLAENGSNFDAYSVGGRANLEALQTVMNAMVKDSGGDAAVLAANLEGLMQSLASYGVNTVSQLGFVQQAIAQLATGHGGTGGLQGVQQASAAATNGISQGFSIGAQKIAKTGGAAKKAAKEIKTLTDYVSDLTGVFKQSYDNRFGLGQAVDKVQAQWLDMAQSAEDARAAVEDATSAIVQSDATIAGLNAANNTLNYQLDIANQYNDVLRATEITADLAKNNADLADEQKNRAKSQKDLTKAQQAAMPSLTGQTQESLDQRAAVLDLVQAYQEQVGALANQGLSQQEVIRRTAELKQQFINQLVQMGYNRAEVEQYAASFDDLSAAIQRVPRNITVSANTDPAQRAIDEFLAKNSNQNINVGTSGGGGTFSPSSVNVGNGGLFTPNIRSPLIDATTMNVARGQLGASGSGAKGLLFQARGGAVPEYHSSGGIHGLHPGGPRGTDTTPAWLTPGEFVVQKSAVQAMGLPYMNALNNQQAPRYLATGGTASGGSSSGPTIQLVEILPTQVQQIIDGVTTQLALDGRVIANSTNANNVASVRRGTN